ncbi:helix-turn-helix domain-containing protein [Mycobacterium sp. DL592]|uniref:winged helix-turn-helix transcriptional regulator n=1 Tax=Mycobacterium sp. DL592 TaxID=2675524 RepID=UPI001FBADB56|nr:helix-turn-helix domain-containing protein [Mycobacterium sp. DL592]
MQKVDAESQTDTLTVVRYEELADVACSITRPLVVLGDRWTFLLVKQAFAGTTRYEDFLESLGIPRGRLADRLDRLVDEGILRREPYKAANSRTRDAYRLTDKGLALYPVLMALRDWGDTYMAPDGPPVHYRHRGCGGEAHIRLECDTCHEELTARDVAPEAGPGMTALAQTSSP